MTNESELESALQSLAAEGQKCDRMDALKELLAKVTPALDKPPDGEWETWTSCSFRRISRVGGGDGDVLHALTQRSDGHPDLSWSEDECDAICTIVNSLRALIAEGK
jgi:hypothetical protein